MKITLKKFRRAWRECSVAVVVHNRFGAAVCTGGLVEGSAVPITARDDK